MSRACHFPYTWEMINRQSLKMLRSYVPNSKETCRPTMHAWYFATLFIQSKFSLTMLRSKILQVLKSKTNDWTRILRSYKNQGGDPQEVQERINWEMGSSKKHAHWYKEGRKTCPISCLQPRKEGFGNR